MNRGKLIIALATIALVLVNGVDIFAQAKTITERQYIAALRKSGEQPIKQGRMVSLGEFLSNGEIIETTSYILEGIPPDRVRQITRTTKGSKVTESEFISIGSEKFQREDGGAWHDARPPLHSEGDDGFELDTSESKADRYSVESGYLDGKRIRIYEHLGQCKINKQPGFVQTRDWIGFDGSHYRTEKVVGKLSPREVIARSVTTYTYNIPGLKIEAPIK